MVNIIKAGDQDLQGVLALLKEFNLPADGVVDHFHNFFVAQTGDKLVGCAGIEIYDDIGLIRSVVVHSSFQGQGLGRKLVETIHSFSIENGLKEIYLLTDSAEEFFLRLGYVTIPREEADPKVKQSVEFTEAVCPESTSVCMVKVLNQ